MTSHRLSKRQSPATVLLRSPVTQITSFNQFMLLPGSNDFLSFVLLSESEWSLWIWLDSEDGFRAGCRINLAGEKKIYKCKVVLYINGTNNKTIEKKGRNKFLFSTKEHPLRDRECNMKCLLTESGRAGRENISPRSWRTSHSVNNT